MELDFIESAQLSTIPKEHLKSTTVENLLSQNEDLMMKLKMAYRRMSSLEEQTQQLFDEQLESDRQNSMLHDQVAILKEKDLAWKSKFDNVEEDRILLAEKNIHLQKQTEKHELEIQRHQKYHEKIKVQIKPYIQQLKKYSQEIEVQHSLVTAQAEQKEAQIRDLRFQILELAKNSQIQAEDQESRLVATVESFESTVQNLNQEVSSLRSQLSEAETRVVKFYKIQEKCDRLENDLVEAVRSRENVKEQLENEVRRLQELQDNTYKEKIQFETQSVDLYEKLNYKALEAEELQNKKCELTQQLESLRYLYGQKSQEHDKIKMSLHSLEKLNVELSQKIHEIRLESTGASQENS